MKDQEVLRGIEINARRRQIELTTLVRAKGRQMHYAAFGQAPPEVRGEALELLRSALASAGYDSFAALDAALDSELATVTADEPASRPPG